MPELVFEASTMPDNLTPEQRRETMARVRSAGTTPEEVVRRIVEELGVEHRLHERALPGTPDIVCPDARLAIFVHGCFWHRHTCRSGQKQPKTNSEYWARKLERNHLRDMANFESLRSEGWTPLVIWECTLRDREAVKAALAEHLKGGVL